MYEMMIDTLSCVLCDQGKVWFLILQVTAFLSKEPSLKCFIYFYKLPLSSGYLAVEGDGLIPGDGHVEGVLQDGGGAAGQAGGHQGQGGCVDNQGMAHGGGCLDMSRYQLEKIA